MLPWGHPTSKACVQRIDKVAPAITSVRTRESDGGEAQREFDSDL